MTLSSRTGNREVEEEEVEAAEAQEAAAEEALGASESAEVDSEAEAEDQAP